jgi:hypothetical protein
MSGETEFRILPTGGWMLVAVLIVLTVIFFVGGIATWQYIDPIFGSVILGVWAGAAVGLWWRTRTLHMSIRDGHLLWRVMERWAKADEPIANIARIVVATNGDLQVEFVGGRDPLRVKARKEYRAEDLRALARLLARDSGRTLVEVDALPAAPR